MPVHEKQAQLANDYSKRGLDGKSGGKLGGTTADDPTENQYEPQVALGDVFDTAWNSATAVREVQTLTAGGTWTGGTFTITYSGQTTAAIPYNATAAQVEEALIALSNMPRGVRVYGTALPTGPLTVRFPTGSGNVAQVTTTVAGLTGTTPTLTPATTVGGVA